MTKIITVPWGIFGSGNIGDEAVLQGFACITSLSDKKFKYWIASRNPVHTKKIEPYFNYYNFKTRSLKKIFALFFANNFFFVGDTPITDIQGSWPLEDELEPIINKLKHFNKKIFFLAIGTDKLHGESSKRIISELLSKEIDYWTVRNEQDMKRLISYGIDSKNIEVTADLAWMLEKVSEQDGREMIRKLGVDLDEQIIGVNLTSEKYILDEDPDFFKKIADLLDDLLAVLKCKILFISNEIRDQSDFDNFAAKKVRELMKRKDDSYILDNHYYSPQNIMSVISCCSLTIGMRYHFCVFSAIQNIPFIALLRSQKLNDLCHDLQWDFKAKIGTDRIVLFDYINQIIKSDQNYKDHLKTKANELKSRSLKNKNIFNQLVVP